MEAPGATPQPAPRPPRAFFQVEAGAQFLLVGKEYRYRKLTDSAHFYGDVLPPYPRILTVPVDAGGIQVYRQPELTLGNDCDTILFDGLWPHLLLVQGEGEIEATAEGGRYHRITVVGEADINRALGPNGPRLRNLFDALDAIDWFTGKLAVPNRAECEMLVVDHLRRERIMLAAYNLDVFEPTPPLIRWVSSPLDLVPSAHVPPAQFAYRLTIDKILSRAAEMAARGGLFAGLDWLSAATVFDKVSAQAIARGGPSLFSDRREMESARAKDHPLALALFAVQIALRFESLYLASREFLPFASPWTPLVDLIRQGIWPLGRDGDGAYVLWVPWL